MKRNGETGYADVAHVYIVKDCNFFDVFCYVSNSPCEFTPDLHLIKLYIQKKICTILYPLMQHCPCNLKLYTTFQRIVPIAIYTQCPVCFYSFDRRALGVASETPKSSEETK